MTTLNGLTEEVLLHLRSYGLLQPSLTTLATALTDTATTVNLTDNSGVPTGIIEVDDELMFVTSRSTSSDTVTVIRGYAGTTAAAHDAGAVVTIDPLWPRKVIKSTINRAITTSYPKLFAVAEETFTTSGTDNTYVLTDETERVLAVRMSLPGVSSEWPAIERWRFDQGLHKLSLQTGVVPGQELSVKVVRRPTVIGDSDDLTVSGLAATAEQYVVVQTCANLAVNMDTGRLQTNSIGADEMDANKPISAAVQVARVLQSKAEAELEAERRRLLQSNPPTVNLTYMKVR